MFTEATARFVNAFEMIGASAGRVHQGGRSGLLLARERPRRPRHDPGYEPQTRNRTSGSGSWVSGFGLASVRDPGVEYRDSGFGYQFSSFVSRCAGVGYRARNLTLKVRLVTCCWVSGSLSFGFMASNLDHGEVAVGARERSGSGY